MPDLLECTQADIEQETHRIVGALTRRAMELCSELGAFGQPVVLAPLETPLGGTILSIMRYAVGDRGEDQSEEDGEELGIIYEGCQTICELLWAPPSGSGGYDVPAEFWTSLMGQAIRACIGETASLADSQELTLSQAARLAGVSRATLDRAARSGSVPVARMVGTRRLFRAGDVRAWTQ